MTHWQEERILCPFCKEDDPFQSRKKGEFKLESNGQHSTNYPNTPSEFSICGGCNEAKFEMKNFSFHRCPNCKTVFLEPIGN